MVWPSKADINYPASRRRWFNKAKGRASINRRTGSNLKAPAPNAKPGTKDGNRRKSFCARSRGWTGERGKAARRRWNC